MDCLTQVSSIHNTFWNVERSKFIPMDVELDDPVEWKLVLRQFAILGQNHMIFWPIFFVKNNSD